MRRFPVSRHKIVTRSYHTSTMFMSAGLFGCLNHLCCNDATVRSGDAALFHFARHAFLDQMAQAKAYFSYVGRRNSGCHLVMVELWEHWRSREVPDVKSQKRLRWGD